MRTFCSCVPRGMVHALLETARGHLWSAAPSLGFMPVETARGELYIPMQRCTYGHWWFVGDYCESCAKAELEAADDRYLAGSMEAT